MLYAVSYSIGLCFNKTPLYHINSYLNRAYHTYIAALAHCWLTCQPLFVLTQTPSDMCGYSLHMSRPSYWALPIVFTQTHWWYSDFDSALCHHWSILGRLYCYIVHKFSVLQQSICKNLVTISQITKFMGPTWGPPGSCRPQMGPMLDPWTLLSGICCCCSTLIICGRNYSDCKHKVGPDNAIFVATGSTGSCCYSSLFL